MVKISDAQAGERFSSLERDVGSLQRAVTELGVSTDLIPEMQADLTVLKDQTERMGTNMNTMQESLHRLEGMWTRQFSDTQEWDVGESRGNFARNHSGFDRGRMEHRGKRLELPLFEGDDPFGWLFRADRYFAVNGIAEGEKVYAASVCLEGPALNWFQWVDSQTPFQSWREFRAAVMQRFGRAQEGDPTEQLLGIKQDSSVAEYRARFEQFAASSRGLPDSVFRGAFLNGLKEEIRSDVKLLRPANLPDAMTLAQEIEERNELWEKHWGVRLGRNWKSEGLGPMGKPKSDPNHMGELTSSPNSQQGREISVNPHSSIWHGATTANSSSQAATHGGGRRDRFFRRLTDAELQQKRAKGLCFRCDEKFAPGHNCANKQLQVLLLSEDDSNPKQEISDMEQERQMFRYLENRCNVHEDAIKFCQNILRNKPVEWKPIFRSNLSQPIRDVDLVVTIGGDGTLLQASHFMDDSIPVLGVNSDPTKAEEVEEFSNEIDTTRSTGYLCTATVNNFEQVLDSIIEGRIIPSQLSRMSISVNSQKLSTNALNDILVAHPCPASVSRFSLKIKGNDQSSSPLVHCRSSGLRVSTAAGSTAAMQSAGGFTMPILSQELQYMVREPISAGATSSLMHGLVKSDQSMDLTWFCKDGVIYIDGSHVYHSIKNGDTIQLSSKGPILKVFLPHHLLEHLNEQGS